MSDCQYVLSWQHFASETILKITELAHNRRRLQEADRKHREAEDMKMALKLEEQINASSGNNAAHSKVQSHWSIASTVEVCAVQFCQVSYSAQLHCEQLACAPFQLLSCT